MPQIVIPHAADQTRQARGVARTGIGIYYAARQRHCRRTRRRARSALLPDRRRSAHAPLRSGANSRTSAACPAAADLLEHIVASSTRPSIPTAHQRSNGGYPVQALIDRIRSEGRNLGNGILKVDGFVNHQLDPGTHHGDGRGIRAPLRMRPGVTGITKGDHGGGQRHCAGPRHRLCPRRARRLCAQEPAHHHAERRLQRHCAQPHQGRPGRADRLAGIPAPSDRVVLIDDFLASGETIAALADVIFQCRATLCGIGCVIEKEFEGGRERLAHLDVPIVSLAQIESMDGDDIRVRDVAAPPRRITARCSQY